MTRSRAAPAAPPHRFSLSARRRTDEGAATNTDTRNRRLQSDEPRTAEAAGPQEAQRETERKREDEGTVCAAAGDEGEGEGEGDQLSATGADVVHERTMFHHSATTLPKRTR